MAEWGVEAVASWLESLGRAGPAALLKAQGVSGADLLAFESDSAGDPGGSHGDSMGTP